MKFKRIFLVKKTAFFPILFIFVYAFFLFNNTLFPPEAKIIYGGDIYDAYYFWKDYLATSIKSGIIPFWNPYNFSGTPFLAHPNINIFYPPNWLFVILPLNWSFSWYFFIHMVIAGSTMYWLVRNYTCRLGALFSAITYAFGGFFLARLYSGHLEYIDAASWVPLVFGLTRKALIKSTKRNIILSGIGMSVLLFAGNELFFLFTLELVFLLLVYFFITKIKDKKLTIKTLLVYFKVCLYSIVLGIGLASVELLPRYQFLSSSLRSKGVPYEIAGAGSLPLSGLNLFINPFIWGKGFINNYNYHGPWPNLFEYTYYVGLLPIVIIAFFIMLFFLSKFIRIDKIKDINKDVWFYLLLIIPIFLIISFGNQINPNIHYFLWRYLPFYKSIRFPVRHLFLVAFSLSVASGMIIGSFKKKLIKIVFLVIITVDLFLFGKQFFKLSDIPIKTFDQELISYLAKDNSLYRLVPDYPVVSEVRRDFDFGAAALYRIQTTSDYNSMVLWMYYRFIDLLNGSRISSIQYYNVEIPPPYPASPYLDFLNAKYLLIDHKFDKMSGQYSGKFNLLKEGKNYKLYENKSFLPRYFFVNNAAIYPDVKKMEEDLLQAKPDLAKTILLLKSDLLSGKNYNLDCQTKETGEIKIFSYNPNKIVLKTKSPCDAFLSSSEVYYPGWKARVDNSDTKIYLSNYSFRSIYLPRGDHTVEFYYQPDIFYIGGLVTIFTFFLIIFINRKFKNEK
uniref:YfhO family protein n=1 Tax=candidate division CPR3 bacterium TaxID=2268181 RepID=A0A7C4M0T5_UNCC3